MTSAYMDGTAGEVWVSALALSEEGRIHQAVFEFESVATDLERQLAAASRAASTQRVQALLVELLGKLHQEIEAHLAFLRGNLFAALEIPPTATTAEVKKAYRALALRYHPDKSGVSPKLFTIVQQAYETLSDPARRRRYAPDKSAQEWASYRQRHAHQLRAHLKKTDLENKTPSEASKPPTDEPNAKKQSEYPADEATTPTTELSGDAIRSMKIPELKARLSRLGVSLRGRLKRSDLEAELGRFASDAVDPSRLADELRALRHAERCRRALALPVDQLRALLRFAGQPPPSFFGRAALATAVAHAFSPDPACEEGGRHEKEEEEPAGAPRSSFVDQLRSQTGTTPARAVPATDPSTVRSEADFWMSGSKHASANPLFAAGEGSFGPHHFFVGEHPVPSPTTPVPVAAGGWFWGSS
ncbi:hypothetical protein CTAYLR_002185 [Chrysophaeum taylorii]|uniref:J domain-containing protein n=1 Tax=Chrysophaeum taylorii TaxID=2483200 RepID=A0AAD7XN71_9STRA|nr:hypothetical protein CTAYLR_002185 [Chrysophaeum taylorii]